MPLLGSIFSGGESTGSQRKAGPGLMLKDLARSEWADTELDGSKRNVSTARMSSVAGRQESEPGACGNALCGGGWIPPWRNRQRPFFEGRWACCSKCLLAMVRAAVAREMGDGSRDGVPVQHRHRVPLGLIMLAQGWITHPQLQKALETQRTSGFGRIGDWLVSECGLELDYVTRGLSVQWSCPVLTTDGFSPAAMAMALPRVFIEDYGILPLRIAGTRTLYVGFQDHLDAMSAFAVEQMNGLKTESGVVMESRFREARTRLLEAEFAQVTRRTVTNRESLERAVADLVEDRQPLASRLVRLHEYYWLRIWIEGGSYRVGGNVPARSGDAVDYLFTLGPAGSVLIS